MKQGIDVSVWQNDVDWPKVATSDHKDFAYIKASERLFTDKFFLQNWKNAKGLIPRGAYTFFRPSSQVKEQIDYFCNLLKDDVGELRPSLDVEDNGGLSAGDLAEKVKFALEHIEETLKVRPIIYTSGNWWDTNIRIFPTWAKKYSFWIAHYNLRISNPILPTGLDDWAIWQYWDRGQTDGVVGRKDNGITVNRVDLNYMKEEKAGEIFIKGMLTLEQRVEHIEKILKDKGLWL